MYVCTNIFTYMSECVLNSFIYLLIHVKFKLLAGASICGVHPEK